MKRMMSPRFFFYLFYGLVLTAVLLYVRFPAGALKTYCEHRLARLTQMEECSIGEIVYHFPFAFEVKRVKLLMRSGNRDQIRIDSFHLSPAGKKILGPWRLEGYCYGGAFSVLLQIKPKRKVLVLQKIKARNIDLAAFSSSMPGLGRKLTGQLNFTGGYKARFEKFLTGDGEGQLVLKRGSIPLAGSLLTLVAIDFDKVEMNLQLRDRQLVIRQGMMRGKDMDAKLTGMIRAPFLPPEGSLQITGLLFFHETFLAARPAINRFIGRLKQRSGKPALRFRIGGTLEKPTFRLASAGTRHESVRE
ncbi:type II secretion system protein GspN [Desulfomarina sp.]